MMPSKGKPTAAAIVEFATVDEATWVVESLNGNVAQGLTDPINVAFKRERSKGFGKGKDGKDGGYGGYGKSGGGYGKSGGKGREDSKGYSQGGKGKSYSPYAGGTSYSGGKSYGGGGGKSYGGKGKF
uniref:RRM domain-containing protein n=1 Tax=Alexandrium catenella TaxID=2925 RepID=A0A7S1LZF8_ALECA|mmetsp:Transcript_15372/g.41959  ORF Transcript_15372/g.41959 Transcript_15372/m.41959 type:complete len:127 (+) Transcript_15372:2-382(+)